MCMIEDAEGWSFYSERMIGRARKEHRCGECRRTIRVGESYRVAIGKDDFGFQQFATCRHCAVASEWLVKACRGYLFCLVLDDLREHYDEHELYRTPMLASLIESMEAGWRDGTDPVPDVEQVRASVPAAPLLV